MSTTHATLTPEPDWETNVKNSLVEPPPKKCGTFNLGGTMVNHGEGLVEPSAEPFGSPRTRKSPKAILPWNFYCGWRPQSCSCWDKNAITTPANTLANLNITTQNKTLICFATMVGKSSKTWSIQKFQNMVFLPHHHITKHISPWTSPAGCWEVKVGHVQHCRKLFEACQENCIWTLT